MKSMFIYIAFVVVFSLSLYNAWNRHDVDHQHEAFFKDMREFKSQSEAFMAAEGETNRFTAHDGEVLKQRIEALEQQ